jgi:hypothetical protein
MRCLAHLGLLGLAGLSGQAFAVIGTIDDVPGATLLLPFFQVSASDPVNGVNTLFSINNAAAVAVLAHVTVWSDQSVPVLDFDVYLTGYDVQTISLRDILINGRMPQTALAGQDPKDTISPQGPISQDINFFSCSSLLPPPMPGGTFLTHVQRWLQGRTSNISSPVDLTSQCAGSRRLDGILRGYVTIDTVNACNAFFPSDWYRYAPFVTDQNVLWGDYFYVNTSENFAQGETLVHIESCPTCFVPGDHTFYGRYNRALADDSREALPTTVVARFQSGHYSAFYDGTHYAIWREANSAALFYTCTSGQLGPASWYPLRATQIVIFNEQEEPMASDCDSGHPNYCPPATRIPNEANYIDVDTDLDSPWVFGWTYLNLQHSNPGFVDIYGDFYAQAWVTAIMEASGRFSVGFDAIQLDNANTPITTILQVP